MNRKQMKLASILANTSVEKKVAAYAAIGLFLIKNSDVVKNYIAGTGQISKMNNVIRTACFDVNEIGIVDIDLAVVVIKKIIQSKIQLFDYSNLDIYSETSTMQDILGFKNNLGIYLEYIDKEFEIVKEVLSTLNKDTIYESLKG